MINYNQGLDNSPSIDCSGLQVMPGDQAAADEYSFELYAPQHTPHFQGFGMPSWSMGNCLGNLSRHPGVQ